VDHIGGARNIRNKRVRIRIKASDPTRKKDPTSAMYSALSIELASVSGLFRVGKRSASILQSNTGLAYMFKRPMKGIGAMLCF